MGLRAQPTLLGLDVADLRDLLGPGTPAFRARQLYDALYKRNVADLEETTALPKELRDRLRSEMPHGRLTVDQRFNSADGTVRYLLKLPADGRSVETVLMPQEQRHTICISSQVGCPVDCRFCLTAQMGLERSLSAGEIVGQVLHVCREHGLDPRAAHCNIVMMGMGEPLLNLPNVLKATRILCDDNGVGFSQRRITVSTSGIVPKIAELGAADIRPKLAISLNASHEEQRRELMPITKKYHLADLMEACRAYPLRPWEFLMFEYVMMRGVNDADADARRVVSLLGNLKAKVNIIALNPGPGIPYETPDPERVDSFQKIVMRSMPCYIRRPRGLDIYAACGQLKKMQTPGLVSLKE
ncbi:MAG: 23S rRNA (adenine(2503)-C(2))-methyltransferase RlmN [Acidobacteria bacterium]|nr:23S rRNA (adenine(2503)-C(2))-methyltransferase RlmN [Acidobacteriota bacterium]